jgi:hypothetical protein
MLICPERFRRNYLTGEVAGASASSLMGTAVHDTIAGSLVALRDWGLNDFSVTVGGYASSRFLALVDEDAATDDPIPWSVGAIEARREEVEIMASALWAKMPGILETWGAPLLIEHTFSKAPVLFDLGLDGTWDLLTDRYVLIDWKTSANSWRPGIEHTKIQPVVYARGVEHVTGKWPETFVFVVVNRRGVVSFKPVSISKERYAFLEKNLPALERMRLNGIFPMNPTSPLCSEDYCPWWSRGCPAASFKGAS